MRSWLQRLRYILSCFVIIWTFFLVQKPIFILCNAQRTYSVADFLDVMRHGASLDATTTGYLTIVPFLLTLVSVWWRGLPLRKVTTPYYAVMMLLVSLIFVADASLFSFWDSKLDKAVFVYIDSPKNAAASVSTGYILLRVLIILLLTAGTTWTLRRITPRRLDAIEGMTRRGLATLGSVLVGGLLFLVIRGGIRVSTANVGSVYYSNDQFLNLSAINPAFNLLASMEFGGKYEDEFDFFPEEQRASLMQGMYATADTATVSVLNTKRPNILFIFMESFGSTMIERQGGVKGVAPTLDRLANEGVFFSNLYANSFRTDRGTVCTYSAYPGLPTLSIMKVPNIARKLPNIAQSLGKAGYQTDFLYGGDINFTNMRGYLMAGGFQKLTSQDDFSLHDRNYSKWGVPDNITFKRLLEMLKEREGQKQPWFTAFLTLSSHEPFEVPFKKFEDKRLNAFAFTDDCIGKFIKEFRKSPQWDNTLIVLLPDHGIPYPKKGERFAPHFFRIPMIWTGGAVKGPVEVDRIANQTDLAATLLAQLGLPHGEFGFSRNVLDKSYTNEFAFYSFVNGFCYLDRTGVSVYDNAANHVFYKEGAAGDDVRVKKGKAILQTLYDKVGELVIKN